LNRNSILENGVNANSGLHKDCMTYEHKTNCRNKIHRFAHIKEAVECLEYLGV